LEIINKGHRAEILSAIDFLFPARMQRNRSDISSFSRQTESKIFNGQSLEPGEMCNTPCNSKHRERRSGGKAVASAMRTRMLSHTPPAYAPPDEEK